jgi:uncharacterized protein
MTQEKRTQYINPYLGGFMLGLVLLSAYVVGGHGLGSSGAIKNMVISGTNSVLPAFAESRHFFKLPEGGLWSGWIVVMFLGLVIGGFISGAASGRLKFTIERGPRLKPMARLAFALAGGVLFGLGAQLGKGCTSGAALSGMAVLSTAGIITMMAIFGTGFAIAALFRRLWV